ncbi:MAG: TIGR03905 family TSCPD domain-containing protein [Desulfovibrionales bacterium]|nr:TIGR03905 family TSCPD domain-containing protein [Desulfovibrionales bacterium]
MYSFTPTGVCAKQIMFDLQDGVVHNVKFVKGCPGSLTAISKLLEGQPVDDVVAVLKGIECGSKDTSCPDRLAEALLDVKNGNTEKYEVKPDAGTGFNPFA